MSEIFTNGRYIVSILILVQISIALAVHRCPKQCICFTSVVDCSDTSLTDVPTDDINPKATSWLLSNNMITILRANSFQVANKIQKKFILDLGRNHIFKIEDNTFSALDTLEVLNLERNSITFISPLALKSDNLHILDLSWNNHLQLPEQGFLTPRLRVLSLARCGLKSIPQQFFKHMKEIAVINLSDNELATLDPNLFRPVKNLRHLDLTYNLFTDTLALQWHHFPKNASIRLNGNRMKCSCISSHAVVEILRRDNYLKCNNNDEEILLSSFLDSQCFTTQSSTSPAPTTIIANITEFSQVTKYTTPTPLAQTHTDNVANSNISYRLTSSTLSSTINDSRLNINGTDAGTLKENTSFLGNRGEQYREKSATSLTEHEEYYVVGWLTIVFCTLGLIVFAFLVAIEVRRRRHIWNSNPQRFSILQLNEETE